MGSQNSFKFLGILSPICLSFTGLLLPLSAQPYPEWQVSVNFPEATREGAPAQTAGGGKRGIGCTADDALPLKALMPKNNIGTTVSANPTYFLYVPVTTAESAEFTLYDEEWNTVYQTTFSLTETPGIVQLKLPTSVSMEIGQTYQWEFAMICDSEDRERDEIIEGWSERVVVTQDLENSLKGSVSPLKQAELYAENQVWHETLELVAQVRDANPQEWQELLKSVDLEELESAPMIEFSSQEEN